MHLPPALLALTLVAAAAQEPLPGVSLERPPGVSLEVPTGMVLELPSGEKVYVRPEDVVVGKALKRAAPQYPKQAKKERVEGAVTVSITVDERGRVVRAEAADGDPLLAPAAVKAARKWRFGTTTVMGQPVKVTGKITFNFIL